MRGIFSGFSLVAVRQYRRQGAFGITVNLFYIASGLPGAMPQFAIA
jgi:hypothetical protein